MIVRDQVRVFVPAGLQNFKLRLFREVASACGGGIYDDVETLARLPPELIPAVGCSVELRPLIDLWLATGRKFVYWDRGYLRRIHWAAGIAPARNLPESYYRWHVNEYQMRRLRGVGPDRWSKLGVTPLPWQRGGEHIVVAVPPPNYASFHGLGEPKRWVRSTVNALRKVTDRRLVMRYKNDSRATLPDDVRGAHCLVTHGSIAAVEAVVLGCPVCVDPSSAAALVGITEVGKIEKLIYPDRELWLHSLAYSQFNEFELTDGTVWRLIDNGD